MQILNIPKQLFGKKIVQRDVRVDWIARAELRPGMTRNSSARQFHGRLRHQPDQLLRHLDYFRPHCGKPQSPCQAGSEQFIDQDAPVLRVILKFHYVVEAVVTAHQVGLRATPHSPYLL